MLDLIGAIVGMMAVGINLVAFTGALPISPSQRIDARSPRRRYSRHYLCGWEPIAIDPCRGRLGSDAARTFLSGADSPGSFLPYDAWDCFRTARPAGPFPPWLDGRQSRG